ncbi:MAG: DNA mismatch repair protein MutS [Planctomycetota bacterium]
MRQYRRFKAQHPECVLFFRMGDFYEMFDEDAKTVHEVLGLTLTQRSTGIPMAGVPHHAAENYIARLLGQGYRVAVCDQIQDPKDAKGVVDRAVTRVLTPGTLVDESLLDEAASNHLAAIAFTEAGDDSAAVIAVAELSTGHFVLRDVRADQIIDEVARLGPTELLYVETADRSVPPRVAAIRDAVGCVLTARPTWTYRQAEAREVLIRQFNVHSLAGFGLEDDDPALGPAAALVYYLQETQHPDASDEDARLAHLRPPRRDPGDRYVTIDHATLRSLEIERTMRSGDTAGSLLDAVQNARTAMGKRLLREWLCYPQRDRSVIEARQHAVEVFRADDALATTVSEHFSAIHDVARIVGRLAVGRAFPRDLVALGRSLGTIEPLADSITDIPALAPWATTLDELREPLGELAATIDRLCDDDPPAHLREGGLFRDGIDAELDEARGLQRDAGAWLAEYQQTLSDTTQIPSLKVGFNKVFGYYIEVTHTHTSKVPDTFTRKQTLKNAERYITPELKTFEDKVTTADSRAIEREKQLFENLCADAHAETTTIGLFADCIAELDVLRGFGELARMHRYVRPTIVDEPIIDIQQGRHPVLDQRLADRFVPNDSELGENHGHLALITGPNMAGKSTYIRQVALIVLLAHTGSFVPADRATIGLTDRIFTRIGASDELHLGQSTFMVEMTEMANILHHATDRSVVVLDELGRGTSTLDGLSLAWAIAESMDGIGSRTLFATHYHELTTLADDRDSVRNLHVAVREWGDDIVFVYRIMPGRTDRSYGIHVAQLAGVPRSTIDRAKALLDTLTVQTSEEGRRRAAQSAPTAADQLDLFTTYAEHPALATLRSIDLNALTPLDAFDKIRAVLASLDRPDTDAE